MNTNFVVYQAYGLEDILNEALVSIASIYKVTTSLSRPKIVIYTDLRTYLSSFLPEGIEYIDTPSDQWALWKGENRFVHRAKIEMLRNFCETHIGNVLYCDTDTYFLSDPSSVFQNIGNGNYVMHTDEGALKHPQNLIFQKLERFLRKYRYQGNPVSTDTHMWNAGVLGFQTVDRKVLDNVLALSDDLHAAYAKHVMEQLAFSICFQQKPRISCEETIFHYWDFKEYRKVLADFFASHRGVPFDKWQVELDAIPPTKLIDSKRELMAKPYWKRKMLQFFKMNIPVRS